MDDVSKYTPGQRPDGTALSSRQGTMNALLTLSYWRVLQESLHARPVVVLDVQALAC
jgi:hypothetical protein